MPTELGEFGLTGELWSRIDRLDDTLDVSDFHCGEPEIDIWLHRDALQQQEEGGCAVYVAVDADGVVIGFFSLSMHYMQNRAVPESVKAGISLSGNIPCVLLGRFGVDSRFRSREYRAGGGVAQGPLLIREAIAQAKILAGGVGCRLMYVQALNDGLIDWYARQGFVSMPKPRNMLLDLKKH